MATFNSALYSASPAANGLTEWSIPPAVKQALHYAIVPYALAGTEAAADIINLCKLPPGSIPVPGASFIVCEDPGTALILDIGTTADPDGWADGVDCQAAGKKECVFSTVTPAWALTATATTVQDISATVDTATTLTAAKKVIFHLAYLPAGTQLPTRIS